MDLGIDFCCARRNTLRMLLLKRHLVELVRCGKKRQTVRLWTRANVRAGQISFTPGLGRMKITAVDELPSLAALTESDAVADGFDSLAALLAEIRKIYGAKPAGRSIYRIRFEWPIDAAGEKLVVRTAAVKARTDRSVHRVVTTQKIVPAQRRGGQAKMNTRQRGELRSFIVARQPRG